MYHELTYDDQKKLRNRRLARLAIIAVLLVLLFVVIEFAQTSAREQATVSVRESVLNAAKQCCAVEGSYPSSLEHLEKYYGLTINHNDFVVSYEWFADNIIPSVVVTLR